mmetsp:Transcript_4125/g.12894  ORF Transcript_4125/g.12894 Transcript_4125/m.12894 type:complete len:470 (-) Transcript_4125:30-1439(-)
MRPLLLATLVAATFAQTVTVDVTEAVKARYEAFPYPAVKEGADDGDIPSEYHWLRLEQLSQYNYGGKRNDFTGFRVLVAGCGTGSAVVGMAHVLRPWKGAYVTALDLSAPSVATTRARLEKFGFVEKEHFALHAMSLLDVAAVTAEPYDLILSTGVLHHLADPLAGLRALEGVLATDGAIALMIYGAIGRSAIYELQGLFRDELRTDADDDASMLAKVKALDEALPPTNHFKRTTYPQPLTTLPDAELVDLLLHPRDRAYGVRALYEQLVDPSGLELRAWAPEIRPKLAAPLPPGLGALDRRTREAVNEVRFGDVRKLKFLLTRPSAPPPPSALDPATILVPNQVDAAGLFALAAVLDAAATERRRAELSLAMVVPGPPGEAARTIRGRQPLAFDVQPGPQNAYLAVMLRLVDGTRDVQTLVARAWAEKGVPGSALTPQMRDNLARALAQFHDNVFAPTDLVTLKAGDA